MALGIGLCSLLIQLTDLACLRKRSGHELISVIAKYRAHLLHECWPPFAAYLDLSFSSSILFFRDDIRVFDVALVDGKSVSKAQKLGLLHDSPPFDCRINVEHCYIYILRRLFSIVITLLLIFDGMII